MNCRSHHIYGVRLDKTGWFAFIDNQGVDIDVAVVQRLVTHARNKGPKVRTKQALSGKRLSVDGPQELCAYHDVFVIGTSYSFLPMKRRHALACSVRLRFRPEGDRVGVDVVDQFDYDHLVMTDGNPGRASMLALALEHCAKPGNLALKRYRYRLGLRPSRRLQREDESALRGRSAALKLHGDQ